MLKDLVIWKKLKDLHAYVVTVLAHYPKSERFTLGDRTQNSVLKMAELTVRANIARDKRGLIHELEVELEVFRFLTDTALELKILSTKQHEQIAERTVELGRLIGGWKRRFAPDDESSL